MGIPPLADPSTRIELTEDECVIVLFLRTLAIDRAEVLRRLASPATAPLLPAGQELQSNLSAVARDPLADEGPGPEREAP